MSRGTAAPLRTSYPSHSTSQGEATGIFFGKPSAEAPEDGVDPENQFQMIPVGRGRPMAASTPEFFEDITIASENPAVANILLFAAVAGRAEVRGPNAFFLQKGSAARFTVFGNTIGLRS